MIAVYEIVHAMLWCLHAHHLEISTEILVMPGKLQFAVFQASLIFWPLFPYTVNKDLVWLPHPAPAPIQTYFIWTNGKSWSLKHNIKQINGLPHKISKLLYVKLWLFFLSINLNLCFGFKLWTISYSWPETYVFCFFNEIKTHVQNMPLYFFIGCANSCCRLLCCSNLPSNKTFNLIKHLIFICYLSWLLYSLNKIYIIYKW